jgi:uncharacterized protein (DUF1684 family)
MRAARLAMLAFAPLLLAATPAEKPTPLEAWKTGIAGQNEAYAKRPHAMLKIQDSVYLGEGESAVLQGKKGDPASWRWNDKPGANGPLRLALKGGKLSVIHNGKAVDNAVLQKSIVVDANVDIMGAPTQVGAGIDGWRIFVFNQRHPAAKAFKSVSYFPYDPAFRVTARFAPNAKPAARVFKTSMGTDKQFYHAGDAIFNLKGKGVRLPLYSGERDPKKLADMSAFFTDDLSNKLTYGAGRYIDVEPFGAFPPKAVTLDFNNAYNPNCALSPHFTCPLAVDEIALEVRAGEKAPPKH